MHILGVRLCLTEALSVLGSQVFFPNWFCIYDLYVGLLILECAWFSYNF